MATAMYLEQYLESLETLPTDLQRNFNLMRDLDYRTQDCLQAIDADSDIYLKKVKKLGHEDRVERLKSIESLFVKTLGFSDDKVNLANQTYEMVDKHIRRLDTDLAHFEAELKEKSKLLGSNDAMKKEPITDKKKRKKTEAVSEVEVKKKLKKEKGPPLQEVAVSNAMQPLAALGAPADVLDMPVDPNEPTYCLCHQVSWGEMIGCDNPDCPIEWFHFPCVNLTSKPKGKWFCPRCIQDKKGVR